MHKIYDALDILYWACRLGYKNTDNHETQRVICEIISKIDRWRFIIGKEVRK